jgi:hypothetical protein
MKNILRFKIRAVWFGLLLIWGLWRLQAASGFVAERHRTSTERLEKANRSSCPCKVRDAINNEKREYQPTSLRGGVPLLYRFNND